jgi:UDP-N-acetylmuramyl pentapeptide phosphotransferase/UDP-N-acetylglucosamine-1-phosphate transferase
MSAQISLLGLVVLASATVSALLILKARLGIRVGMDLTEGVQKLHSVAVPRTGGVAVLAALVLGTAWLAFPTGLLATLAAALPALLWGLSEDLTRRRSPLSRLLATLASGLLLALLAGLSIPRLDLPIDPIVPPLLWILLTSFAVSGLSNAINIIDGVNGLASFVAAVMFAGLAQVAARFGDQQSLQMALLGLGACVGFFLMNWPRGSVFLGDGGAYLLGFWLGASAISLIQHNPQVTAWFVLALFAYPVTETIFSSYRRRFHHELSPTLPDRLHLHSLVYLRRSRWRPLPVLSWINPNSATLIRLLPIVLTPPLAACLATRSTGLSMAVVLLAIALYLIWFRRLVRFKLSTRPRSRKQKISLSIDGTGGDAIRP